MFLEFGELYATSSQHDPLRPLIRTLHTAKPPAICETGGFALSPQTRELAKGGIVGAVEPDEKAKERPVRRGNHTPVLRGLIQIG